RRSRADHLRAAAVAGGDQTRRRSLAFRRGAGDRDGDRPVRAAARARALWGLHDPQRADRADRQADPGLSRTAADVPAGDRLRAGDLDRAAARAWLLTGRTIHLESPADPYAP